MTAKYLHHKFTSAIADGTDGTLVRPSNWNDDHDLWLGYRSVAGTSDTITNADHLSLISYNNAAAVAVSIAAPGAGNFSLGWQARLRNAGLGTVTVSGTGGATINGGASISISPNSTLDLHSTGASDFVGVPIVPPSVQTVVTLGGILTYVSATQLKFAPYGGSYVRLNGAYRSIPVAGIAGLGNTGVYVNGVAGQNLAANTTYLVFVFDVSGTLTADFRTGATHATSGTLGNEGVEILTGNDTRTLIGMCRTNASSQFQVDGQNIGVLSWFNKRSRAGLGVFTANRTNNVTTYTEVNSEIRVNFLCWADPVQISMSGTAGNNGTLPCYTALAVDGTTIDGGWGAAGLQANCYVNMSGAVAWTPSSEGWHTATIQSAASSGITATYYGAASPSTLPPRCSLMVTLQG